jgi:hypothetical protein
VWGTWGREICTVMNECRVVYICCVWEILPSSSVSPSCAFTFLLAIAASFVSSALLVPSACVSATVTHFVSASYICLQSPIPAQLHIKFRVFTVFHAKVSSLTDFIFLLQNYCDCLEDHCVYHHLSRVRNFHHGVFISHDLSYYNFPRSSLTIICRYISVTRTSTDKLQCSLPYSTNHVHNHNTFIRLQSHSLRLFPFGHEQVHK